MYSLTEAGEQVFEDFIQFYQNKVIESNPATPQPKPLEEKDTACVLATFMQTELPLLFK
jgi:hypothetical protein